MKTKLVKFLSASRYSTECTKCGFQFRRYCSKSGDKSSKSSDEKVDPVVPPQYLSDPENLIEFEAPEKKIKLTDYAKSFPEYMKEDIKRVFKFSWKKNEKITDRHNFPYEVEFLILGAGPMGSSVAFWLAKTMNKTVPVLAVDKNLSINQIQDGSEVIKFASMFKVMKKLNFYVCITGL